MNGYEKRTKIKKDAIINVAKKLFSERGITNVGVSEIAAKAHVSQVSIYNYFGDKNTLAREVLTTYLDQAIQDYEEILEEDIPFSEKLKMIIEKKQDKLLEVSCSHFSKYALEDNVLQQVFQEAATIKAVHLYNSLIELGKKAGAIDERIPNDVIQSYVFLLASVIQQPHFTKTDAEYKTWLFRLFLYGLFGKEE